jgi:hypothetical protein
MNRCNNDLQKYDEKLQVLDNMNLLATQSLEVYFQTVRNSFKNKILVVSIGFFLLAYGEFTYFC